MKDTIKKTPVTKNAVQKLQFRLYLSGDENGICDLHNDVFPDNDQWTVELWKWRYCGNFTWNNFVCIDTEGISGHLGSVEHQFEISGKIYSCSIVMDAMTAKRLRTKGAFLRLVSLCLSQLRKQYPLTYSFLNNNSYPIFHNFYKWKTIGNSVPILARPLNFSKTLKIKLGFLGSLLSIPLEFIFKLAFTPLFRKKYEFASMKRFNEKFTSLWQNCPYRCLISRVRDHHYLSWRYLDSPQKYQNVCLFLDGNLRGYGIIRVIDRFGLKLGLIMELVTDTINPSINNALLGRLLLELYNSGADIVSSTCFPHSPWRKILRRNGFFAVPKKMLPHLLYLCVAPNNQFGNDLYDQKSWYISYGDIDSV